MKNVAARVISIVGHPFVTGTAIMLVRSGAKVGALFFLIAIVPVAVLMFVQVRRGAWTHVDASNRGERPALYIVGIGASAAAFALIGLMHPSPVLLRAAGITLLMFTVFAVITRWVKVSLHVSIAALAATILVLAGSAVGWVIAALLPALIWSRLHLKRHTWLEVLVGLAGGIAAGLAIHSV